MLKTFTYQVKAELQKNMSNVTSEMWLKHVQETCKLLTSFEA